MLTFPGQFVASPLVQSRMSADQNARTPRHGMTGRHGMPQPPFAAVEDVSHSTGRDACGGLGVPRLSGPDVVLGFGRRRIIRERR